MKKVYAQRGSAVFSILLLLSSAGMRADDFHSRITIPSRSQLDLLQVSVARLILMERQLHTKAAQNLSEQEYEEREAIEQELALLHARKAYKTRSGYDADMCAKIDEQCDVLEARLNELNEVEETHQKFVDIAQAETKEFEKLLKELSAKLVAQAVAQARAEHAMEMDTMNAQYNEIVKENADLKKAIDVWKKSRELSWWRKMFSRDWWETQLTK